MTLRQSVTQPFCGDDLVRFFERHYWKNPSGDQEQAGAKPFIDSSRTVRAQAIWSIHLLATHQDLPWRRKNSIRIKTFMDNACEAGRVETVRNDGWSLKGGRKKEGIGSAGGIKILDL